MEKYTIDQLDAYALHCALGYTAEMCDEEDVTPENQDALFDYAQKMGFWFDQYGDRIK